ncbi:hypothetical protein [Winogradskyella endarachnes]|uniref:Uncharacterized protein n=1 Tax=Winogradskyella endarachnes TaxID=2681965 RepID=A0A6L6U9E2_9FLAO|nr:hypothetical protein [Winogradskyella endarachnes]MUU78941.1 hypothetical protein [Winogradskyella endarachnes]
MLKKTLIFFTLFLITNFGFSQSENIKIKSDKLDEFNYIKADDFYLTHHLYIDLFLRENLFPEATPEDVYAIISALKKYVSIEHNLDIEIDTPGKRDYLIRFAILKKEDGTELLIAFTNWNSKEQKFEKNIKIENDSYTRWYFLNKDKMTYRKDMSNKNDYSKLSKSDLANAYLFDEVYENDYKIKSTIDEVLSKTDLNLEEKITANLMLLKYYIFKREVNHISQQTEYLNQLFINNASKPNLKALEMAFKATKFQIELMHKTN